MKSKRQYTAPSLIKCLLITELKKRLLYNEYFCIIRKCISTQCISAKTYPTGLFNNQDIFNHIEEEVCGLAQTTTPTALITLRLWRRIKNLPDHETYQLQFSETNSHHSLPLPITIRKPSFLKNGKCSSAMLLVPTNHTTLSISDFILFIKEMHYIYTRDSLRNSIL